MRRTFLVGVVGLAGAAGPALGREEVVLGASMPLSGPAAYWGASGKAMDACGRWINEQGGVHGRRIRVEVRDDGYLPARAAANVRELADPVGIFALVGLIGTTNVFAVRDFAMHSGLFWITPQADASVWYGWRRELAVFYQNDLYGHRGPSGSQARSTRPAGAPRRRDSVRSDGDRCEQGINRLQLFRMQDGPYERLPGWIESPVGFKPWG